MTNQQDGHKGGGIATTRLPREYFDAIEGFALIDGTTISDEVRQAAGHWVVKRLGATTLPTEVAAARARVDGVLDRLLIDPGQQS